MSDWRTNMRQAMTSDGVQAAGSTPLTNGVRDWETKYRNAWTPNGLKIVGLPESGWLISGEGAPTTSTVGKLGTIYIDTDTGNKYECTNVSTSEGVTTYTWTPFYMPVQGEIAQGNNGWVSGGQVYDYNSDNIKFRSY